MKGYDTNEGYRIEPLDDRDDEDPHWSINPIYSSPDFQFSEEDPATVQPRSGTPAELATMTSEEPPTEIEA
jgi:hypothetical protein